MNDVNEVFRQSFESGGAPNISDALTINGQPGDLFPCSMPGLHQCLNFMKLMINLNILYSTNWYILIRFMVSTFNFQL